MGTRVPAQKHTQELVPPNWEPGSRAFCPTHKPKQTPGTGSPKLGIEFQNPLPAFKYTPSHQESVPPNWEPGSKPSCQLSNWLRLSGNRFLHSGNRVPLYEIQFLSFLKAWEPLP